TGNGYTTIKDVGTFMVYAQNDPLWERMTYESRGSGKKRKFGEGGCGPTAAAMAIVNLVDVSKLPTLIGYSNMDIGYTFCTCSVNRFYCNRKHAQYQLRTPEEFLRYMPLAVANFATGNNIWNLKSRSATPGTNMRFLEKLCNLYRLRVTGTRKVEEALAMLKEDPENRVILSCSTLGGPFTRTGHYVVIVAVDDQYIYLLDPLRRSDYSDLDRLNIVEPLAPGVVRIKLENATKCNMSPLYVIENTEPQ
ncbi:MAG: hypothetical protein RSC91_12010, partial [Clostridia bacterium]